jgi:hypothetical protein
MNPVVLYDPVQAWMLTGMDQDQDQETRSQEKLDEEVGVPGGQQGEALVSQWIPNHRSGDP